MAQDRDNQQWIEARREGDYKTDCKTCHVPAKKDDWVYVRGYPVLAKPTPPK
jgi:hypothetical protein